MTGKRVDPIALPQYPEQKDPHVRDYFKSLNAALQWFCDQTQTAIDNSLLPYQVSVFGQSVSAGTITLTETFSPALAAGTTYTALVIPNWLTTWAVATKSTAAVTISFGTAPTPSAGLVDVIIILQVLPS